MKEETKKIEVEVRSFGRLMAEKMDENDQLQITGGASRCCTNNHIDDGSVQSQL